ncbi:MAG: hypothetical protein FJY10_01885 [Bacteroidetes bacterium]|nr:hypothetical protein [Bacteroidota bacterium]
MLHKVALDIVALSSSQSQSGAYALILGEKEGIRRLPIIIGGFEAQAIAVELEKIKPIRPLTHDLFKTFAMTFGINIREVIINKFQDGIFYAKLICWDGHMAIEIDSRTSDAVALALRFECPIYTYEHILKAAGLTIEEERAAEASYMQDAVDEGVPGDDLSARSISELQDMLQDAINREDYETASRIRDELKNRKY